MGKLIVNRIKAVLAEKAITNKQLAQHLGITESSVSRWCTNEMQPSLYTLHSIAAYLKVDIRELLVSTSGKE
jgi:putative transcriptional regulator